MENTPKAENLKSVKSLAKSVRKNLGEKALTHTEALEIAANSYGFTNWHACQSYYKTQISSSKYATSAESDVDHIVKTLKECTLTFTAGNVTVSAVSACRSFEHFFRNIMLLGLNVGEWSRKASHILPLGDRCLVNTLHPVKLGLPDYMVEYLIFGLSNGRNIIILTDQDVEKILATGMKAVWGFSQNGNVNLDRLSEWLKGSGVKPDNRVYAVRNDFWKELGACCQIFVQDQALMQ